MNLSNSTLVSSVEPLRALGAVNLPIKASFSTSVAMKKVEESLKSFEAERMKLIEKYGERDDAGKIKLNEQGGAELTDAAAFSADYSELLSCEQDIDIKPIPLSIMGDALITPAALTMLGWLIDGDA